MQKQPAGMLHVSLSIDVAFIPNESNPQDRLSVSTRALLTDHLLALASLYHSELQSALAGKLDVRSSTRLNIPGLGLIEKGANATIGVQ